jgi:putative membrane protein
MMLIRWILGALAVIAVTRFVPGIAVDSFLTALLVALVLGLLNAVVRPLLVLLTLPVTVLSLGFFVLVINAILFMLASAIVPGFSVDGFWTAFLGAIVYAVIGWGINLVFGQKRA